MSVTEAIWHDLECGAYEADLPFWRQLASQQNGQVLEVGAGTGRVAIDLAEQGHRVTALDIDSELLAELSRRGRQLGLLVATVAVDAREFELEDRFGLIVVPMQTIQLLGGPDGRARFLQRAAGHLEPAGRVAIAITELFDLYDGSVDGASCLPMADVRRLPDGLYRSQPTAVREEGPMIVLERRREILRPRGSRRVEGHEIRLDRLTAAELELEGRQAGLRPVARVTIPATEDHVGSLVVIFDA